MGASPSLPSLDEMTGTYTLKPEPSDRSFVSADTSHDTQVRGSIARRPCSNLPDL